MAYAAPNPVQARGSVANPRNRFEKLEVELEPEDALEVVQRRTEYLHDHAQSIISYNTSPDISFDASLNPYRGCEHGCAYCYARPTHEYAGMSAGLDFETRILVKERAPELLREELSARKWKPQSLAMSGVTDCYQPIERKLEITRRCLEVLRDFRNPVTLITKNHLITRDVDLFREMNEYGGVAAAISITTLDGELSKALEPRASSPSRRLAAIEELCAAGIPVTVMFAPSIPGLNDHEMPAVFAAAKRAGAIDAGYVALRLPFGVAPLFEEWLERHAPGQKEKVLNRVREMRGGKMYDSTWGERQRGTGIFAEQMARIYEVSRRKAGFPESRRAKLSTAHFRVPTAQLSLGF